MKRRTFIAGLVSAPVWPLAARAQQGERVRRVGVLSFGADRLSIDVVRDELRKRGWIEGRNLQLEVRLAAGDLMLARTYAKELVQLMPDALLVVYAAAMRAMQQETMAIPIVVAGGGDVVESGWVKNPAHPEGNVTGFANSYGSLGGKWMELLKEAAPSVTRVAYLYLPDSVSYLSSIEAAAKPLGLEVVEIPVTDAAGARSAIETFAAKPNGGLLPSPGVIPIIGDELLRLATQYRLPAISGAGTYTSSGALMSYQSDLNALLRGTAGYLDRLLRGAKVGDLPVQFPSTFRLTVNLKTARAIGLTVPESFLLHVNELIE
jgi:putative ABC transport system substrate-binding protein